MWPIWFEGLAEAAPRMVARVVKAFIVCFFGFSFGLFAAKRCDRK